MQVLVFIEYNGACVEDLLFIEVEPDNILAT